MSYSRAGVEKFTIIDDLLDIDDLESSSSYSGVRNQQPTSEQVNKHIRTAFKSHNASGMTMDQHQGQIPHGQMPHGQMPHGQIPHGQIPHGQMPHGQMSQEPMYNVPQFRSVGAPTCLDIADHVSQCPICSKFYNNDKTLYILAIAILMVICILLFKRVME